MCDMLQKKAKRTCRQGWIDDERFKDWIHKVPLNEEIYYCSVCKKDILCSTHPSKHAASGKHKYQIDHKRIDQNFCHSCKSIRKSGRVIFKKSWMNFELFKPWLREVPDDQYSFFCLMCEKTMSAHLSHIYRHAESSSHLKAVEAHALEIIEEDNRKEIINMKSSLDDRRKNANFRYAKFIAEKRIPFHIAAEFLNFFQEMSHDPETLQSMRMGVINSKNIISHALYTVGIDHEPDQNIEKNLIET
ncbi:hypothetical protein PV327_005599 [Microctonus hyperodae]|uniref:Uncharacterized protein n=1 Tax=Microctonus hyperodae TaxID=165561 RepID=A0AA39KZQ0_MICHY|nr:hypothetical protein PV327_005599 [Microctonus hyperodae]